MNLASCFRSALAGATALCGAACIDIDQKLVLNPDGSGKVTLSVAMAMPDLGGLGLGGLKELGGKKDPKAESRELAVTLLRAEGIEAWSDVTYGVGKDGKNRTSVTGYFPDATKVRLAKPMDDKGSKEALGVSKDSDGNWVIETRLDNSSKDPQTGETTEPAEKKKKELTDEEVEEKLVEERQQWASMKGFMGGFFEGFRVAYSVEGGGTITKATMFEKKADNLATFEYSGKKLLEAVDAMLQDDEKAKAMIKKGVSPSEGGGGGP